MSVATTLPPVPLITTFNPVTPLPPPPSRSLVCDALRPPCLPRPAGRLGAATTRRVPASVVSVFRWCVCSCPDWGTRAQLARPLRLRSRRGIRDLSAAPPVAVVEAGGRTVSLANLLGHEFAERSHEMFSHDRFHPSPAGYARVASVLLPSVCDVLGLWSDSRDRGPDPLRGERVGPVAVSAGESCQFQKRVRSIFSADAQWPRTASPSTPRVGSPMIECGGRKVPV